MRSGDCCGLNQVPSGYTVEVVAIKPNGRSGQRLAELGLTPATRVHVLQSEPGQPMLLRVRCSRLAVDRVTAQQLEVRVLHRRPAHRRRGRRHGRGRRRWFRRLRGR
jgi:Fe2+ transport system protein FeoA